MAIIFGGTKYQAGSSPTAVFTPQDFKARILAKYPDGTASDGTPYAHMDAQELLARVLSKYPDGVTNDGIKYSDFNYAKPGAGPLLTDLKNEITAPFTGAKAPAPKTLPGAILSTFGSEGTAGAGQTVGKSILAPFTLANANEVNMRRQRFNEAANQLIALSKKETDKNRKSQMLTEAHSLISQSSTLGTLSQAELDSLPDPDLSHFLGQLTNTALNATMSGGILKAGQEALTTVLPKVTSKVGGAIIKQIPRVAESVALTEGFNTASNLNQDRPAFENAGPAAAFAVTLPLVLPAANLVADKIKEQLPKVEESMAYKLVDSWLKPLKSSLSYGKDPTRALLSEGIVAKSYEDGLVKVNARKSEVGSAIGQTIRAQGDNVVSKLDPGSPFFENPFAPLDQAIREATQGGEANKPLINRLQQAKKALSHSIVSIDENGEFKYSFPLDFQEMTQQKLFDWKDRAADMAKWTGSITDDKAFNSAMQDLYRGASTALERNNEGLARLNQRYSDLKSASVLLQHRDEIQRSKPIFFNISAKVTGLLGGLFYSIVSGGATIPAAIAGLSLAVLEKKLVNGSARTRVAQWLMSASENQIKALEEDAPQLLDAMMNVPYLREIYQLITGREAKASSLKALEEASQKSLKTNLKRDVSKEASTKYNKNSSNGDSTLDSTQRNPNQESNNNGATASAIKNKMTTGSDIAQDLNSLESQRITAREVPKTAAKNNTTPTANPNQLSSNPKASDINSNLPPDNKSVNNVKNQRGFISSARDKELMGMGDRIKEAIRTASKKDAAKLKEALYDYNGDGLSPEQQDFLMGKGILGRAQVGALEAIGGGIAGVAGGAALGGLLLKTIPGKTLTISEQDVISSFTKGKDSQVGEFTAYNAEPGQTDARPKEMASGKEVYDGALASADETIPFGTRVYVPQLKKIFVVEDRLGPRIRSKYKKDGIPAFDIYTTKKSDALKFGRQRLDFIVLGQPEGTNTN